MGDSPKGKRARSSYQDNQSIIRECHWDSGDDVQLLPVESDEFGSEVMTKVVLSV